MLCVFFCEALEQEQVRGSNRNQTNVACGWCVELTVMRTFWDGGVACMLWWYNCLVCICCLMVDLPCEQCAIRQCWSLHVRWKASLGGLCAQKHIHVALVKF